jgi:hypothetical protein
MSVKRYAIPGLLVAALIAVAITLRGKGRLPATPEEAVNALFQAAQRGDVPGYLATMTAGLRANFASSQAQLGAETFVKGLRESVAGMKGIAVSPAGETSSDRAELNVELVFSDRNERQRFVLVEQDGGWLIDHIGKAERVKPPIPYGAAAFDAGSPDAP